LPRGSPAFERAVAFWESAPGNAAPADNAHALLEGLQSGNAAVIEELVMQAPLASVLGPRPGNEDGGALLGALAAALPCLSVPARARLAGALMERLACDANVGLQPEERLLHDLVRGTSGQQLVELKRAVGTAGNGIDLLRLVHGAVTDRSLREGLLAHFRGEAVALRERPLHVLSDVDMTFWVGNFGCGGPKFPHGPVPGARPLLRALGGQVTFLTARPQVVEAQTRRELFEAGVVEAGLLAGDLGAVLQAAILGKEGHSAMGEKKAERFNVFKTMHPEARFIFIGDSGEGDVDFATGCLMPSSLSAPSSPHAGSTPPSCTALIHDVTDETGTAPRTPPEARAALLERGVAVFDSYAGAALRLHELGFLTAKGLLEAAQGCHDEFLAISPDRWASEAVYLKRYAELMLSIDSVDDVLRKQGAGQIRRGAASSNAVPPPDLESFLNLGP